MPDIYDKNLKFDSLEDAVYACDYIDLTVSELQSQRSEGNTRTQSKCDMWFSYRAGRITASAIYDVCHTSSVKPSHSVLMKICYPLKYKFLSVQTNWGLTNKSRALAKYNNFAKCHHSDVTLRTIGFVISSQNPCFGSTPDFIVTCSCCGTGTIELKCPYSV